MGKNKSKKNDKKSKNSDSPLYLLIPVILIVIIGIGFTFFSQEILSLVRNDELIQEESNLMNKRTIIQLLPELKLQYLKDPKAERFEEISTMIAGATCDEEAVLKYFNGEITLQDFINTNGCTY